MKNKENSITFLYILFDGDGGRAFSDVPGDSISPTYKIMATTVCIVQS
jgi:hypothetical protein